MTYHPLLVNDEVSRNIRAGLQTQDRRPVKPTPVPRHGWDWCWEKRQGMDCVCWRDDDNPPGLARYSPYGVPGDRLWCREAHRPYTHPELWTCVQYRCDMECMKPTDWSDRAGALWEMNAGDDFCEETPWRPNIHMPRWACRTYLEVLRVWVERVQDISITDIGKEGFSGPEDWGDINAVVWWRELWDSIYGTTDYAWDRNPWVWACEFRRVEE